MVSSQGSIIERHQLENGMEIILYDQTRRMGADRWIVELEFVAYIPIEESLWHMVANEDQQTLAGIRKKLGDRLKQTFTKKRIFVEEHEREHMLEEMIQQVFSGMMEYLKKPNFPTKLFKKQYHDARQKILLQQAMDHVADD